MKLKPWQYSEIQENEMITSVRTVDPCNLHNIFTAVYFVLLIVTNIINF